jgi:acetolactate decarboxylase
MPKPLLACALLCMAMIPMCASADQAPACRDAGPLTVYVVRHAEREDNGTNDPPLSELGRARAFALADTLADVVVDAVYTTQLIRTVDTAAPLLSSRNIPAHRWPVESGQAAAHVNSLAEVLCDRYSDASLLVVGHSNTVPQLVAALIGRPEAEISEREYDHLYQVRLEPGRSPEVLRARFGAPNRPSFKVAWRGALRAFHHGDVEGKVDLTRFAGRPNLVAVGPVGQLDGEVTVRDGEWFITRVREGAAVTSDHLDVQAGFLVWADVPAWADPLIIDSPVADHRGLEERIAELAETAGLDTETPFPFRIRTRVQSLHWHVLAPHPEGEQGRGHLDSALKRRVEDDQVELVGFFSRRHAAVFTHRNSWAHIHVVLPDGHAGHVDAISLAPGAELYLPQ